MTVYSTDGNVTSGSLPAVTLKTADRTCQEHGDGGVDTRRQQRSV